MRRVVNVANRAAQFGGDPRGVPSYDHQTALTQQIAESAPIPVPLPREFVAEQEGAAGIEVAA